MGLLKTIELENGVTLNYHRVVSINNITNMSSNIEVASYTGMKQRDIEHAYQQVQLKNQSEEELTQEEQNLLENGINVYIETKYYSIPYNKDLDVDNAYQYLKTLDEFKNSQDA